MIRSSSMPRAFHLFSVDVEDYFQVSAFEKVAPPSRWESYPSRVEGNTRRLLDLLDAHGASATFFTVGWVAERFPALVQEIVTKGHEVASHSHLHRRVTTLTPPEFRSDVRRSREVLEQVAGVPVVGFRAPSFSIVPEVSWAWEILCEEGFLYDSSAFPIVRPGYGNPQAPRDPYLIRTASGVLEEYPLATAAIGRLRLPAAGGAYLRVLPPALVHRAITEATRRGTPAMCYVHPWEIDAHQPRLPVGLVTRFRHYTGLAGVYQRLNALFGRVSFRSVQQYRAEHGALT